MVKPIISQVLAPSLRCLAVNGSGNILLTWDIPSDPSALFTSYEIYRAPISTGPFTLLTTLNTYTQTTYLDPTTAGNTQSQHYYIKTIFSGSSSSMPSEKLNSIFLNLTNPGGQAILTWNATSTPLLPTAANTYTLERADPSMIWSSIYNGTILNFKDDSISLCRIFYNYRVLTSDALGCNSVSNIGKDLFQDNTSPDIPNLDSVSVNLLGQSVLGWKPANALDTKGYEVYNFIAGIWTKIATVLGRNTTSYTNLLSTANTGSEKYCILAFDSCNNLGLQGIINNTDQNTIYLTTAYDLCSRSTKLNWNAYLNIKNNLLQYDVYCSVNGALPTIIATVTNTNYVHESLTPNSNYCYFIRVRNVGETISASSNIKCLIALAPTGPSYVYIKSVSVNLIKQIEVTYTIDNLRAYKGATIFKSMDGIVFSQIAYQAYTTSTLQTYIDVDVQTKEKNYFYKIQISDSCGNLGQISNVSKSILLKVNNETESIFYNTLTWDSYSTWLGNVNSYNIYRSVNGVFETTPFVNVNSATTNYVDNISNFASDQGKFSYYVEAVEGIGNLYGFSDRAKSNPADAYVEAEIFVPNAFAPRGLNKIWLPIAQYVEKTNYKVIVFNRWGTKVFETSSDTEGWDGAATTDDTYVYFIEYKNSRGEFIQLKGHLNLIR